MQVAGGRLRNAIRRCACLLQAGNPVKQEQKEKREKDLTRIIRMNTDLHERIVEYD